MTLRKFTTLTPLLRGTWYYSIFKFCLQSRVSNRTHHFEKLIRLQPHEIRQGINLFNSSKGKDKVHPRTVHEGPEVEQMYSSTLPSTSALNGGGWSTPCPGHFAPGKDPVPIVQCGTLLVAQLVEARRYKPEGRGFDSRWCHWNFSLT